MTQINPQIDLRSRFGSARNQGGRPTCLAFAMSDAHAAVRGEPWTPLSAEYLFFRAKQRDAGSTDAGTTMGAVRAAIELDGQPLETYWPYLAGLPKDLGMWKPPANVGRLYSWATNTSGSAFTEIWDGVETNTPVVIALTISDAFFLPDTDCIVDSGEAADPNLRHAVIVVGTGMRNSQKFILVRNSWGPSWGCSGYAWLSERYSTPRVFSAVILK